MGTEHERTQSEIGQVPADPTTQDPVFETEYDHGPETDGLTVVLVDALADVMGVSPTEVAPRISESVDPDAMERIFRPLPDGSERAGRLTVFLFEFRITIRSDGVVRIYERRD